MRCFNIILISVISGLIFVSDTGWGQTQSVDKDGVVKFSVNIAVLDVNHIYANSSVVKSISQQIDKYRKNYQDIVRKERLALQQASQELDKKRTLISPEAFKAERQKFEKKVAEHQQSVQQRGQNMARTQRASMGNVTKALNKVIDEYARKNAVILVLRKEQVAFSHKGLEITNDILAALNKALPNIKVAPPDSFAGGSLPKTPSSLRPSSQSKPPGKQ